MFDLETAIWDIIGNGRNKEETGGLLNKLLRRRYMKEKNMKKQKIVRGK